MRQRTKITITAFIVMLFMALAVTVISFSFADEPGNSGTTGSEVASGTSYTNIDYIIKNSNDTDLSELNQKYRIVEIGSGPAAQSTIGAYVANAGFEDYVIDGNKSSAMTQFFKDGNVKYNYFNAASLTSTSVSTNETYIDEEGTPKALTDFAIISQADMIYISNCANPGFAKGNDISEDLLSLLQPRAVGDYIPIIIDIPGLSGPIDTPDPTLPTDPDGLYFGNAVNNFFNKEGRLYYTFRFKSDMTADSYFDTSLTSTSEYLSINARNQYDNGLYVEVNDGTSDRPMMGKMLIISKDGGAYSTVGTVSNKLLAGTTEVTGLTYPVVNEGDTPEAVQGTVIKLTGSPNSVMYEKGYNSRYQGYNPTYIQLEDISVAELETRLTTIEFDKYDMIFVESDVKDVIITTDLYNMLGAAMNGGSRITYSNDAIKAPSSGGTTGGTEDIEIKDNPHAKGTNYEKLYNMVTSNNVANYSNIMPTYKTKIKLITGSASAAGAKPVADLINSSSYRGIGGPSSNASTFAVLEIQPCYPIDEDIAAANLADNKEGYYNDADAVMNGLSKEEIIAQRKKNGVNNPETGFEYYAWELSKAKIADALNKNVNNITLTQMSTEELAANKTQILGNYDLVYIGGNKTALKDLDKYYGLLKVATSNEHGSTNMTMNLAKDAEALKKMPIYTMYSHNGDFASYDLSMLGTAGYTQAVGSVEVGKVFSESKTLSAGFTRLNGNDISSDNLAFLKEYVDAGMPIVISKDVTDVYSYIADNIDNDTKYYQNSIDPDSNMCTLLNYCNSLYSYDGSSGSSNNILWNFSAVGDAYTELVDSDNGRLSKYANEVRVFNLDGRTKLNTLYLGSTKRPKLVMTSQPKIYNVFDNSSVITDSTLMYKIDKNALNLTSTTDYSINLYIDDNGNSKFEAGEGKTQKPTEKDGYLTVVTKLNDDFFGPVYWKIEVVDGNNKVYQTGLSYIRPENSPKQDVALLQILPGERKLSACALGEGGDSGGANGLYFCVKCQQAYKNMYYNPVSSTAYGDTTYYYGSNHFSDNNVSTTGVTKQGGSLVMGLHEHDFGIVSYDSEITTFGTNGADDWNHNLADDLKKYYNFDAEIMYVADFEEYAQDIAAAYADCADDAAIEARKADFNQKYLATKSLYDAKVIEVKKAEDNLNQLLQYMIDNLATGTNGWNTSLSNDEKKKGLETIISNKCYSELYAMTSNFTNIDLSTYQSNFPGWTGKSYNTLYSEWVKVHDEMLLLKGGYFVNSYTYKYFVNMDQYTSASAADKAAYDACNKVYTDAGTSQSLRIMGYKDYKKFSEADNWLKQCYTTICIGPSEQFAGDDIENPFALKALSDFLDNDGQLVMFHDTLSPYADKGSVKLTNLLRTRAGANKYHAAVDSSLYKDTTWDEEVKKCVYPWSMNLRFTVGNNSNMYSAFNGLNDPSDQNRLSNEVSIKVKQGYGDYLQGAITGRSTDSFYANGSPGTVKLKLTFVDSANTPIANENVTVKIENTSIQATGTTNADGYVELDLNNYYLDTETKSVLAGDILYTPYKTTSDTKYPSSVYYTTNLSYKSDNRRYATWVSDMNSLKSADKSWLGFKNTYISPDFTDSMITSIGGGNTSEDSDMYKYAEMNWNEASFWGTSAMFLQSDGKYGTDKAKKNNDAIVTMFPFQLADDIYIGGTHPQAYALDVDYDNLTVLYSLAAGTTSHTRTSIFAADPGDGTDNYFIYACDNIYYCGAGHGKITGMTKNNQNERYLYLNIICNSVRKSAFEPTIDVYDPDSTDSNLKNDIVKKKDGQYLYKIEEDTTNPNFSFKVGVDDDATITQIKIFYDLDYLDKEVEDTSITYADGSHPKVIVPATDNYTKGTDVLIANWAITNVVSDNKDAEGDSLSYQGSKLDANILQYIIAGRQPNDFLFKHNISGGNVPYLTLNNSYFAPYGGKYTYIVIRVTDSNGGVRYQRIKIEYKDKLFNLT